MPLICSFASGRSRPARIQRWIDHLETLARRAEGDEEFQETVRILLDRAYSWLPEAPRRVNAA
jgi:hypothetical protein